MNPLTDNGFQTLLCASVWALSEEREAMNIVANHSHICWHTGQSAVLKNPLNSAQMLAEKDVLKMSVPTGNTSYNNFWFYGIVACFYT